MTKELQDLAWRVLPAEFKEEVKHRFQLTDADCIGYEILIDLFGIYNLTSDAEGEDEMLCVSRKNVQKMYSYNEEELTKDPTNKGALLLKLRLDALFGSKCLPDEGTDCTPVEVGVAENATTSNVDSLEPKPSEPKFKYNIGQKVKSVYANEIMTIKEHCGRVGHDNVYKVEEYAYTWNECELRPCTEPNNKDFEFIRAESVKEARIADEETHLRNLSQETANCDKHSNNTLTDTRNAEIDHFVLYHEMVDSIIKDGFSKHNRLHIVAILAAGMLASEVRCYPVDRALELADELIAKCEKGGQNEPTN